MPLRAHTPTQIIVFQQINKQQQQYKTMGNIAPPTLVREGWVQKFGKVQFSPSSTTPNQQTMIYQLQLDQKLTYHGWIWQVEQIKKNKEVIKYLHVPLGWRIGSSISCFSINCGQQSVIEYERFGCSLSQQIKNRRINARYFEQSEIWYILLILLKVSSHFQKIGSSIGNVHPDNLFLDQNGHIKVASTLVSPVQLSNFQKIRQSKYSDVFVAPQEIQVILAEDEQLLQHSETFAIGITLLQISTLKDCYFLYNRSNLSLNQPKLNEFKRFLQLNIKQKNYSDKLCKLICKLTQIDPKYRKTPQDHYKIIETYQNQILQFKSFKQKDANRMPSIISQFSFGDSQVIAKKIQNAIESTQKFNTVLKIKYEQNPSPITPKQHIKLHLNNSTEITRRLFDSKQLLNKQ